VLNPLHYTFGAESEESKENAKVTLFTLEPRHVVKAEAGFPFELDMLHTVPDWPRDQSLDARSLHTL
jgi:hypothetical protein